MVAPHPLLCPYLTVTSVHQHYFLLKFYELKLLYPATRPLYNF